MIHSKETVRGAWPVAACACLVFAFASEAIASCGDYLRHGGPHNLYLAKFDVDGKTLQNMQFPIQRSVPPTSSACEHGKCQQAPLSVPSKPVRFVPLKQLAAVVRSCSTSFRDNLDLIRPIDGVWPELLFLDIESPPPRAV